LRAILYAKALIDIKKKLLNRLPTTNQFNSKVKIICKKLNLQNKPSGINEIRQIEFYLNKYSINIIDGRAGACEEYIYKGVTTGINNKNYIYIVITDSHYNVIPSMLDFFDKSYYCNYCKKGYDSSNEHTCIMTCRSCKKQDCIKTIRKMHLCKNCKIRPRNEECFNFHNEFFCSKRKIWNICNLIYKKRHHVCYGQKYCVNCKKVVSEDHKCYIKPNSNPKKKLKHLIFFDYEVYHHNNKHVPNLIVAKLKCISCLNKLNLMCKCEEKIFFNNNDFCEWLFSQRDHCIAIAHNFKGYDSTFVQDWILNSLTIRDALPIIIMNGSKIIS
jgi:hypothetical protein